MKIKLLFAILTAAALSAPVSAQENETPNGRITGVGSSRENKTAEKVFNLRLKGAPISRLLDIITAKTGYRFSYVDPGLSREKITIFFSSATPEALMEFLTKAKDLEFQRLGTSDSFLVSKSTGPFEGFPPLTRQDIEDAELNRVISVRVKGIFLPDFLNIVSEQARVNFVVDAEYIPITADLSKITVMDVLQFLKAKGLAYSRIGRTRTFVVRSLGKSAANEFAQAEKAFANRKYEETIAIYEAFLRAYPDSEMADYAILKMAISYDWIAGRDNDTAALKEEEKLLNRLVSDYPKSSRLGDAYLYLGQIYSGLGGAKAGAIDCKMAIKFYELAIKTTYRDWVKAQAGGRMAQCYELDGNKEKAEAAYREIMEKYPDTAVAKELRGRSGESDPLLAAGAALEAQGEYKLAIEVYKRLLEKKGPAELVKKAELRIGICQAALDKAGKP